MIGAIRIPLYCHNFYNYDAQFILNQGISDKRVYYRKAIPASTEKMKAFFLNHFDFRDSLAFLPSSLENCVKECGNGRKSCLIPVSIEDR